MFGRRIKRISIGKGIGKNCFGISMKVSDGKNVSKVSFCPKFLDYEEARRILITKIFPVLINTRLENVDEKIQILKPRGFEELTSAISYCVFKLLKKDISGNPPKPIFTLIEGSPTSYLSFRDFCIIPNFESFEENIHVCFEIYKELRSYLREKFGRKAVNMGEFLGFSPPYRYNVDAILVINNTIEELGYSGKVFIGIGCWAEKYYDGHYKVDDRRLESSEYFEYICDLLKTFKSVKYLENPFSEKDLRLFRELKKKFKSVEIIGRVEIDPKRVEILREFFSGAVSKIFISVSNTVEFTRKCKENGLKTVFFPRFFEKEELKLSLLCDYLRVFSLRKELEIFLNNE